MPELNFDQWIARFFDQPIAIERGSFPEDSDWWECPSADIVACLTRTFAECDTVLKPFSEVQVAQGLDFLVGGSEYMQELKETRVPLPDRLRCIEAMGTLFENCFAKRCTPHLSHLDEPGASPLNGVCYMWWEILPLHGMVHHAPEHPDGAALDRKILDVISRCLEIDSEPCQESALLGLLNWSPYYAETTTIINDFLSRHPNIRPELRTWAIRMREG